MTYREFSGSFRSRGRWMIVAEQELRVLWQSKMFKALLLFGLLQPTVRMLQIILRSMFENNPGGLLLQLDQAVNIGRMGPAMLLEYIQFQSPSLGLMMLYAGAGAVGNDVRNNLCEVYFSKPIRWTDYVAGKFVALSIVGHAIYGLPGLFLIALHKSLSPQAFPMAINARWMGGMCILSLLLISAVVAVVLGTSSWLRSHGLAAISVASMWVGTTTVAGVLVAITSNPNYLIISFPMALNRIGEQLLLGRGKLYTLSWTWSVLYIVGVTVAFGWLFISRTRALERSK